MTEFDDALRQSFARIAEPGDPAGVAAAIRERMAAGDTGAPAATSGFGAGRGWFLPYLTGAVVLVGLGLALGASGVFTTPTAAPADRPAVVIETADPAVTPSTTPTATMTPTATPLPPEEAPLPVPPADTAAPTLGNASATPASDVCADDSYAAYYAITSTINAAASDNVGVAGVHVTWSGAESGSAEMSVGSSWTFVYNPAQATPSGTVTFTLVARDAAGNPSAPATTTVAVIDAGSCLI